jgi:hypothetical protein
VDGSSRVIQGKRHNGYLVVDGVKLKFFLNQGVYPITDQLRSVNYSHSIKCENFFLTKFLVQYTHCTGGI